MKNYEKYKASAKSYKEKHKKKIQEYQDCYNKQYYLDNKEKLIQKQKEYYQKNKDILNEKQKIISKNHYILNKEKKSNYQKDYLKSKPGYMTNYVKERIKIDVEFKIMKMLRTRFYQAIKNKKKYKSSIKLVGCSLTELKEHIEKQFKVEMNWNNYGKIWEIDHIKPCSKFDLTKLEEQQKCFHYTNLQPLLVSENRSKKDKFI